MFVGAAEDNARSLDPLRAKSKMDLAAAAGLGTIRMTSIWSPGQRTIAGDTASSLNTRGQPLSQKSVHRWLP